MQNYIKIYRDVVDKTFCETLIEKFESSKTQQQSWPEGKPFFTQIKFFTKYRMEDRIRNSVKCFYRVVKCF